MTHEQHGKGDQKLTGWNYKIDFVYSDDFFKSRRIGAHKGNKFLLTKDYLYLAQVADQDTQEVMLSVASSREKFYNFQHVDMGNHKFREHSYTFLDSSERSVFLHVNHFGERAKYGHIYISDNDGTKFSKTLSYNSRSNEGESDFGRVYNQ